MSLHCLLTLLRRFFHSKKETPFQFSDSVLKSPKKSHLKLIHSVYIDDFLKRLNFRARNGQNCAFIFGAKNQTFSLASNIKRLFSMIFNLSWEVCKLFNPIISNHLNHFLTLNFMTKLIFCKLLSKISIYIFV